jgi:hypothetical protein
MRVVIALWPVAAALALATSATAARSAPGPFSTPYANPETPTITLHVGQTATFARDRWRPDQRVTCAGNGDALDGEIPGLLGLAPMYAQELRLGRPLVIRLNHGLELSLVPKADHSVIVSCARHA